MSLYCKSTNCPKANECIRAEGWREFQRLFPKADTTEGFATCLWYIDEQECINNNFEDGAFYSKK